MLLFGRMLAPISLAPRVRLAIVFVSSPIKTDLEQLFMFPLQVVTNDQQDWSPAFRGICLYFQRLARPLDEVNLFRAIGAVPSGKAPLQLEVGLSLGAIQVSSAGGCAAKQSSQHGMSQWPGASSCPGSACAAVGGALLKGCVGEPLQCSVLCCLLLVTRSPFVLVRRHYLKLRVGLPLQSLQVCAASCCPAGWSQGLVAVLACWSCLRQDGETGPGKAASLRSIKMLHSRQNP